MSEISVFFKSGILSLIIDTKSYIYHYVKQALDGIFYYLNFNKL